MRRSFKKNALETMRRLEARVSRYGLTVNQFDDLIQQQDRRCAICNMQFSRLAIVERSALVIDHCHTKGTVRGLLCSKCNTGIGFFNDDPESLRNAIRYLDDWAIVLASLHQKWRLEEIEYWKMRLAAIEDMYADLPEKKGQL